MLSEHDEVPGGSPRPDGLEGRATSNVTQNVTQKVTQADPTNAERQRRWRKKHPGKHRVQQRRAYASRREAERVEEEDFWTVYLEVQKREREARALAYAAGLSVRDWLAQKPPEERQEWAGVEEMVLIGERVEREVRESDAITKALYYPESEGYDLDGSKKVAAQEAAKRMKELNITREEMEKEGRRNSGFSFDRVLEARRRKAAYEAPLSILANGMILD